MSDVGQNYHSDHYKCPVEEGHVTNIHHDNYGITHTFMEVDRGAPIRWYRRQGPRGMEYLSKDIGKGQQQEAKSRRRVWSPEGSSESDDEMEVESHSEDFARSVLAEDVSEGGSYNEVLSPVFRMPQPQAFEASDAFEGRDVCTEQLEQLIEDVFDGSDSDKSVLAYCLDAQRKRWELRVSRRRL